MKINIPKSARHIIDVLYSNGYEAFVVGGCVRDSLMGIEPKDWDITTSASPMEIKRLFPRTVDTGIQHGTVTVRLNHTNYEVTTFRIEDDYVDGRHPSSVSFTNLLSEDLKRRDFTINAMAYNDRLGIVDEFDGIGDLESKVIRCVGNPRERFAEDALRMMRAVRFAAQLGFTIDEDTKEAIRELAPTLSKVSKERIAVELVKILVSDHPEEIRTAYQLGLTKVFMPEFDVAMETIQNNHHHMYTVGEHSIVAMQHVRSERMIRLIMLLHDLAKPVVLTTDDAGYDHFVGHQQAGADMARGILRRLKFDNATIDFVYKMIRHHDDRPPMDNKALVRRRISQIGLENMPMMIEIKRADILGQSQHEFESKMAYVDQLEQAYLEIIEKNYCVNKKDLSVNGNDLIAMGMRPGEEVGVVLDLLFEIVLNDPKLNEREKLLERAHKLATPFIG